MPSVYTPAVPELMPLVDAARRMPNCSVEKLGAYYYRIRADGDLVFSRKEMKMKPAVWYGLFTGGLDGRIVDFSRDEVTVAD